MCSETSTHQHCLQTMLIQTITQLNIVGREKYLKLGSPGRVGVVTGPAKVRSQKKKRYYLGIFPKRRPPPPFWEPLIQKKILVFILHFRT